MVANETSKQVLVRIDVDLHNQITEVLDETGDKSVPEFLRRGAMERLLALSEGKANVMDMLDVIAGEATKALQHMGRVEKALNHLLNSNKLTGDATATQALYAEIGNTLHPPKPSSYGFGNYNHVLVNTNRRWRPECEADMLANHKASAYYQPWGKMIENNIRQGDWVFLYASGGEGIIAYGQAASDPETRRFDWDPEEGENETFVKLKGFYQFKKAIPLKLIRQVTGTDLQPRRTVINLDSQAGDALVQHLAMDQTHEENEEKEAATAIPDWLQVNPQAPAPAPELIPVPDFLKVTPREGN